MKTLGLRIREQRIRMHMTQEELAEIMCIPKSTISAYENDKVDIKGSVITELSRVLHTTPDYLLGFGDEDEMVREIKNLFGGIKEQRVKEMILAQIKAVAEMGM